MIDEASYFLQASRLPNLFEVYNGYPALKFDSVYSFPWWAKDDRLYPSYPGNYAFIAYPFFALLGLKGLFLINTFSFTAVMYMVYSLLRKLNYDEKWGILAVLLLAFCTFSTQYVTAIWPHMLSTSLVLASFYLLLQGKVNKKETKLFQTYSSEGIKRHMGNRCS